VRDKVRIEIIKEWEKKVAKEQKRRIDT